MTDNDRRVFAGLLQGLGEAFNEPVSEQRAQIYFEALEDLPIAAISAAVRTYVRGSRFFPRPIDLRESALGSADDQAELAWQHVVREVKRVGWTGRPLWPDGATERAALGLFGGSWRTLCEHLPASGPELLGYRKAFVGAFGAAARAAAIGALPPSHSEASALLTDLKAQLHARGLPTGKL